MQVQATLAGTASADLFFTTRHSESPYWVEYLPGDKTIDYTVCSSPVDQLRIRVNNKTEGYIELQQLVVDGIDLQHVILQGTFYPNYHPDYYTSAAPPASYTPGTEWYHNGEWCLDITTPIWEYMVRNYA